MKYTPEDLIHKYNHHTCSEEELALIESWHLKDIADSKHIPTKENISLVNERMWRTLSLHIGSSQRTVQLWPRFMLTASVVFVLFIAAFFYLNKTTVPYLTQTKIVPGGNKAILVLGDGKKIILDQANIGLVANQGDVHINKATNGKLTYLQDTKTNTPGILNQLITPRGGNYQVVLSDGTKVWLNAASTLSYPNTFDGNERSIKLTGEAYFEVAKNSHKPFKVVTNHQIVEVLGTHFNINAYPDIAETQTTLIEGSIRLLKGKVNKVLIPGQTAITNADSETIQVTKADLEKNMAWKNNEFVFNGDHLSDIMKVIGRWYDVEIIYKDNFNQTKYWGVVSRTKNISEVLRMLQSTGKVTFKIEGRRVIIMD